MKKFFAYIGIVLFIFAGLLTPIKITHGQPMSPDTAASFLGDVAAKQATDKAAAAGATDAEQKAAADKARAEAIANAKPSGCGLDLRCYAQNILAFIGYLFMTVTGLLLFLGGKMLNFVLDATVVNFAKNISGMVGINIGWKVFKDLMNIAIIFLLVYESIKVIISLSTKDNVRKFVVSVVLVAILINFSLFFTKLMIDASNIVTIGFYNAILGDAASEGKGLSNPIMNSMGLSSFYLPDALKNIQDSAGKDSTNIVIVTFGASIFFLIAAFIFFAISVMFIVRYILLILLLMFSALAYMGMAFPSIKSYSNKWWSTFNGQLLWAPIWMIMMWVILSLITSAGFTTALTGQSAATNTTSNTASLASAFTSSNGQAPTTSSMGLLINFGVIVGLLVASMVTAKSFASQGDSLIGKAVGNATSFAGGLVMGGAGRLGRNTLGRAGNALANSESLKNAASKGGLSGWAARTTLKTSDVAAKSSFDVRAAKVGSLGVGDIASFGKVDSKKANFRAELKDKIDIKKKQVELYKPSDSAVDEAKARLLDANFQDEERRRKAEHDAYLRSEEYQNSNENKRFLELQRNIANSNASARPLEQQIRNQEQQTLNLISQLGTATSEADRIRLNNNINKSKELERNARAQLEKINSTIKENQKELNEIEENRDKWMSDEMKQLVETAGGTKALTTGKKNKDAQKYKQIIGDREIEGAYQNRANNMADREENTSAIWRYTANTIGTPLNAIVPNVFPVPKTKTDRQAIAKAIRKVPSGKSKQERALDALKEVNEEDKEETTPAPATAAPAPGGGGGNTTP